MTAVWEPLFKTKMLDRDMSDLLKDCVKEYFNIFICGMAGSGRTTMLNLLASFVPVNEPIAVIEDQMELRLPLHTVRQLAIGGVKDMHRRKIVKEVSNTGVRRLIVGDCLKGEAYEILRAMSGQLNGSIAVAPAFDCEDLVNQQLPGMVASIGFGMKKDEVIRLVAESVDLVILMKEQRIEQIAKVMGTEKSRTGLVVKLEPIYEYDREQDEWLHRPLSRPPW